MHTPPAPPDRHELLELIQDDARQHFVATFPSQWDSLRILVDQLVAVGPHGPVAAIVEITNRLSALATSLGFPTVGARATDLGHLASETGSRGVDALRAHVVVDAMMEAFHSDFATASPAAVPVPAAAIQAPAAEAPIVPAMQTPTAPVGPEPVTAEIRTAVIADDDPDVIRIVDAQMRAAGYQTVLAFDGEATLAAVRTRSPDVLVLDLMMPKQGGFDVLSELRDGPAPRPRTIVLSALAREENKLRAFELGADDYMTKPFNPQELLVRIDRLLK